MSSSKTEKIVDVHESLIFTIVTEIPERRNCER